MTENARGVIAESYAELQGLALLDAARRRNPVPTATWDSCVRSILQSVEIGLLNLSDLLGRATVDVRRHDIVRAATKLFWARGFHRVLVRLSLCPDQLGFAPPRRGAHSTLRLADSPALAEFLASVEAFDGAVIEQIDGGELSAEGVLAAESLGSAEFNLLHLARICSHESTIWEEHLAALPVCAWEGTYADFIAAPVLRDAVYDRQLRGDTFFMQFRGLHQIPETLGEEVNDHVAAGIADIRRRSLHAAVEHLCAANALTAAIESCLPPMVDSLATSDYHQIRENLGLTSGSHSVCLRYDMFTHLYAQLASALLTLLAGWSETDGPDDALETIAAARFEDPVMADAYLLVGQCIALRSFIFQWRALHLHLPRNNLGGEQTRSLTGSVDAVRTVANLRDTAMSRDPFAEIARWWRTSAADQGGGGVAAHTRSATSLDAHLLAATGHVTQAGFTEVQERSGFFSRRCAFTPPPPRSA
jgi:hypothetical protein